MKNFKSMRGLAEEIAGNVRDSLSESASKFHTNDEDNFYKEIERFLKRVYGSLGINLSSYTKRKAYNLDEWLAEYLTEKIQSHSLPAKREIEDALKFPSKLSKEIFEVIKRFNASNFDEETCENIEKRIRERKDSILKSFKALMEDQEEAISEFENHIFFLFGKNIRMADIDALIGEVYQSCHEDYVDSNAFLTKKDIAILDFLKLDELLKHIDEKMTPEVIEGIRNFNN